MKIPGSVALMLFLTGCQTVAEVEFRPSQKPGTFETVEQNAKEGFEYVELQATAIVVLVDDSKKSVTPTAAEALPTATGSSLTTTPRSSKTAASAARNKSNDQSSAAKKLISKGAPAVSDGDPSEAKTDDTKSPPVPSASIDPVIASSLIDGRPWIAKVVPTAGSQSFLVKGQSGNYWRKTSLGVAKYPNTDLTSSVSVKAENLVAVRIGQIAGVAAKVITTAGVFGVSTAAAPTDAPLLPFSIPVGDSNKSGKLNDSWTYSLNFDGGIPKNVVSVDEFIGKASGKKVKYWPVPVCRAATLSLYRGSAQYDFKVVVASPSYVRLQPLPVDGKITLGLICSSSTTGAMSVDSTATLLDEITALQGAAQTIKEAKDGGAGEAATK